MVPYESYVKETGQVPGEHGCRGVNERNDSQQRTENHNGSVTMINCLTRRLRVHKHIRRVRLPRLALHRSHTHHVWYHHHVCKCVR